MAAMRSWYANQWPGGARGIMGVADVTVTPIDGPDDARVADYRLVPERELLRRRNVFVAEGRLVVQRLIEDRRCHVRSLLVSDAAYRALGEWLPFLPPDTPVYVCAPDDFLGVTGFNLHRGCLAIADRPPVVAPCELFRSARTLVVLEGVTDADNVGGVFRNAAAFGVDGVLLSPTCCDPLYRKAIRTSMGATLRVPFATVSDWPDALSAVKAAGLILVGLTPSPQSVSLDDFCAFPRSFRLALMLGTEGAGLTLMSLQMADVCVRIPIESSVNSLNVAVAAGIVLSRCRSVSVPQTDCLSHL